MTLIKPTRRAFLASTAGLVIAVALPQARRAAAQAQGEQNFAPDAFIRIAPDNTVTVLIKHLEMGQGANTGLASVVAEELDADWAQMRAESAPANTALYTNFAFGIQGVGGSTGMANSYMQMRKAGAAARAMLVEAAARDWGVDASAITVEAGTLTGPDGQTGTFGDFAEAALDSEVPADPALKDPSEFKLIGQKLTRLDSPGKTDGTSEFTIDIYLDGMETVAVLHPPKFGATVASVNDAAALEVPGVTRVAQIPTGVAVYGTNTYAAFQGRDALEVEWDESGAETRSSAEMAQVWAEAARGEAREVEASGDIKAAFADAATTHEAEFVFPFLAHAPLEPLDGVIQLGDGEAEVWMGSQLQTVDHGTLAGVLQIDQANVALNTMYAGGSFGRRATPASHFAAELANVASAAGPGAYKLLWTRENDIRGGYYRPLTVHHLRGALDADGKITGWQNTIANQSIIAGSPFEQMMQDGLDPTSYEGSTNMPYDWPAHRVSWARMESGVPVLWWRAVGHTHTAYSTETFLDELLEMGGQDQVQGRLDLISAEAGRDRAVLERVADMAGWSGPGTGDRRMGVALHESFGSYVAMIAEVEDRDGHPFTTKVWCAVDCGFAVNPDVVISQMEGGIGFGLGTTLYNEITIEQGGRVRQSNFDQYRMIRIYDMPQIEVAIVNSQNDPSGVGEPGVPPIAPAMANAWRSLTGATPRRLPLQDAGV